MSFIVGGGLGSGGIYILATYWLLYAQADEVAALCFSVSIRPTVTLILLKRGMRLMLCCSIQTFVL